MAKRKKQNRKQKRRRPQEQPETLMAQEGIEGRGLLNQRGPSRADWAGPDGSLGAYIREESDRTLAAYRQQPNLINEHANHEEDTARGGYATRQLFELVQNSADALAGSTGGHIWIRLTSTAFYCADEGRPIDADGITALMFSHLSSKRGTSEIGRFGLGFKSVLGITNTPEFFSHSGSFRFNREKSAQLIMPIAPNITRYPVLRLPEAIDPWLEMETDPILRELMGRATNIVRLPVKPKAHQALVEQIEDFPAEFLLFVEHVSQLTMQTNEPAAARSITLRSDGDQRVLHDSGQRSEWIIVKDTHKLSPDAKNDSRSLDDASEVPISWAAPVDLLDVPGHFWAFFPTMTPSLLAGILNAPWKTNEDRQNLLEGTYNDELIDAAAVMVADALPRLSKEEDPARHLEALPRRAEAGDAGHSNRLREQLYSNLHEREIVPDQAGNLRKLSELSYPPRELTPGSQPLPEPLKRWEAFEHRPLDWLHHGALTRKRLATLDRLHGSPQLPIPRETIAEWLEALVKGAKSVHQQPIAQASMAAVQTAASIPLDGRQNKQLGEIVLTAGGRWATADPDSVFLGRDDAAAADNLVHPQLQSDPETLNALEELGFKPPSQEIEFRRLASTLLGNYLATDPQDETQMDGRWREFWLLSRTVDPQVAVAMIKDKRYWQDSLRARTIAEKWRSLFNALLPGDVVPSDGSRDSHVAIDIQFHEPDVPLLKQVGVDSTCGERELSRTRKRDFIRKSREQFTQQDLPHNPKKDLLKFLNTTTAGPLDVLDDLSEEGRALYTSDLLAHPSTYKKWRMRHETQAMYPPMDFESPAVDALREYGRIRAEGGIYPLSDALGDPPRNPSVKSELLRHSDFGSIRQAFGISVETNVRVEQSGEDDAILLIDEWPGLAPHLPAKQVNLSLIRCDRITRYGEKLEELECNTRDSSVYIIRKDDDQKELLAVLRELGLYLSDEHIEGILSRRIPADIQAARGEVRSRATDGERLLAAVGETELRSHLPGGLVDILEDELGPRSGVDIAHAAIATFHTGVLREYRHALDHLDPPKQWAGTTRAVEFVRSLGFDEDWAGDRYTRRDPFIEVEGPYSLPELHDYQRKVVRNMRTLIRSDGALSERRGMISMPTGSGKTRVAVQAIVEAIREDGLVGGILWVADRDELCEQAVEAWRQVWSSEGTRAAQLRISRMWAGQPQPLPTSEMHVIVATIQTLSAKIASSPGSYEFLSDFKLVVFDEAHRSVASTFTLVMQELGLTRWKRTLEPLLIGLTATPYRGHDEQETERLVNRYGRNRLDTGAFASDDPEAVIRELQAMRVLAQADHRTIEGGSFHLSDAEVLQSRETPWLPSSVEERIAHDTNRTRRIIDAYREQIGPESPTLIFATSVEHSRTVAALLSSIGIRARAVSATTDTSVRRRIVEEFRAGEIKALVNYGIFREGFDAPKTRAIIVARPVYSPNLYFQMIGRGLRGVKNGGNDRCLILNVSDNIDNFERKLAFSDLDWLWA